MRILPPALAALSLLLAPAAGSATPGDRVVDYRGGGQGRVTFDVRTHEKAGLRCPDCHAEPFPTRRLGLIAWPDHERGTACFACHDGERASKECAGCHRR
ncbi:MAG TPA: cytochrome c3 family protein [Anaeromyxobacter sp.]|nr:cytochrome c3 family protein [Anaeromyxobacter sp.]